MICWARYLLILTVVALGITSIVGACGRKGPLYMPPAQDTAARSEGDSGSDVPVVPTTPPASEPAQH